MFGDSSNSVYEEIGSCEEYEEELRDFLDDNFDGRYGVSVGTTDDRMWVSICWDEGSVKPGIRRDVKRFCKRAGISSPSIGKQVEENGFVYSIEDNSGGNIGL